MNGPKCYASALAALEECDWDDPHAAHLLAYAQVCATLAVAGALIDAEHSRSDRGEYLLRPNSGARPGSDWWLAFREELP